MTPYLSACSSSGYCDCYQNRNEWDKDFGTVTKKNYLPLMVVMVGDTGGATEEVYFWAEPLTCKMKDVGKDYFWLFLII